MLQEGQMCSRVSHFVLRVWRVHCNFSPDNLDPMWLLAQSWGNWVTILVISKATGWHILATHTAAAATAFDTRVVTFAVLFGTKALATLAA